MWNPYLNVHKITCRFADSPIRRHPDSSTSRFVDSPIRRQPRMSTSTNRDKKIVENAGLEKSQFVDNLRTHTWSTQSQACASPLLQFRLLLISLLIEVIREGGEGLIKHHKNVSLFSFMNSALALRSNFRDSIQCCWSTKTVTTYINQTEFLQISHSFSCRTIM